MNTTTPPVRFINTIGEKERERKRTDGRAAINRFDF
jgi:hypothetical protein